MPLPMAIKLRDISELSIYGNFVIFLFVLCATAAIFQLMRVRGKPNGITEVIIMSFNSFWVVLFSILVLV